MKFAKRLIRLAAYEKEKDACALLLIVLFFILLRIPSLAEPYWYGDEGIYQVIGMAMREGRGLYEGIWDNKPPLLYIIYALFNGEQFWVRLVSLLFGAASVVVFYFFALRLFASKLALYVSTVFYAFFFGVPLVEGNIANSENFMHLPTLLSFYLVYTAKRSHTKKYIIAGILLSLAFLIKIVAIFDLAAIGAFMLILQLSDELKIIKRFKRFSISSLIKKISVDFREEVSFLLAFLLLPVVAFIYFFFQGALGDYVRAAFSHNVGYVGYGNYFLFPMGLLVLKASLLLAGFIIIFSIRKKIDKVGVLLYAWLLFSLFNALFSARPYTHYLLTLLPAFAFFIGYTFDRKKMIIINLLLLVVAYTVIESSFDFNFKKTIPYYNNYIQFIFDHKEPKAYQAFFDRNTPRDYEIAEFIKSHTTNEDNVFLWSDSGQIYKMAGKLPPGRYIVAYHITFYKDGIVETQKDLANARPKYIIQTKDHDAIQNFLSGYMLKYRMGENVAIYERTF